jgi:hypothetical protein
MRLKETTLKTTIWWKSIVILIYRNKLQTRSVLSMVQPKTSKKQYENNATESSAKKAERVFERW